MLDGPWLKPQIIFQKHNINQVHVVAQFSYEEEMEIQKHFFLVISIWIARPGDFKPLKQEETQTKQTLRAAFR